MVWLHGENVGDAFGNDPIFDIDLARAIRIHIQPHRIGHADGISHLNQHLIAHASSHQILGNVTGGIGCGSIHLGWVFSTECAPAVGTLSSIGVNDDFSPRQSRVSMGPTNDKLACGVDMQFVVALEEGLHAFAHGRLHTGNEDVGHIVLDFGKHLLIGGTKVVVLRAQHHGFNSLGRAVVLVLNGHLALGIRTQIRHLLTRLPNGRELAQQPMRQFERKWHVIVRLLAGIAKHHALVTRPLFLRLVAFHTLVDVRALFMNRTEHAA